MDEARGDNLAELLKIYNERGAEQMNAVLKTMGRGSLKIENEFSGLGFVISKELQDARTQKIPLKKLASIIWRTQ